MKSSRRLVLSMDEQTLKVFRGDDCLGGYLVSTALKGMGFQKESYQTPTGRFRVIEKIGDGLPSGTIFKCRVPVGIWHPGEAVQEDLILTRILRLDGLDDANANTLERCIYIHGTHREDQLGQPVSHGCVRLGNADMIELFGMVTCGDLLEIQPLTQQGDQ